MMKLLAPVDNIRFDIEDALEKQTYAVVLPFTGMDKSAFPVCELFAKSNCDRGSLCPFRHVRGDKSVVCKHWLRGLCKKGDECEFLHEYDMSKMPECFFYSRYSQCGNKECEFLHLDKQSKIKDCPWYDRGFCRHGPNCKNRHVKKVICQNFLFGFCPDGPSCKFKHPKFELPVVDPATMQKKQLYICDFCGEKGHKASSCFKSKALQLNQELPTERFQPMAPHEVTCFKCGEKGHYANRCNKSAFAFLRSNYNKT